jgi:OOP family OmpA-OmpF porin
MATPSRARALLNRFAARAVTGTAAVLLALPPAAAGQTIEEEIDGTEQRLEQARAEQFEIMSPSHFERAEEDLREARERYDEDGRIEDIRERLARANEQLDEAEQLEEIARVLLRDALAARADALAAQATEFAAELWNRAESKIRDAGRDVERGRQNKAREQADEAVALYREAELRAIRADLLGRAERLRSEALRAKVDRYAPASFARADSLLQAAEQVLEGDRYEKSEAGALAQGSASEFQHASLIASTVQQAREDGAVGVERVLLENEEDARRVAAELGFEPSFADGFTAVTDQLVAAIRSLYEDRANLQEELGRQEGAVARLRSERDSLEAKLAITERREATVTARLRERELLEQRFIEAQALFSPEEGVVLSSGGKLIVRLHGLTFAVGSADIRPEDYSLLTKVQRVLREFPDAPVVIEGHTDAQGNDALNQSLSQRRAIAVREYLLANMAISADRITAVGYGESRPVASNQTADGRAQNRRIDVVLEISGNALISGGGATP